MLSIPIQASFETLNLITAVTPLTTLTSIEWGSIDRRTSQQWKLENSCRICAIENGASSIPYSPYACAVFTQHIGVFADVRYSHDDTVTSSGICLCINLCQTQQPWTLCSGQRLAKDLSLKQDNVSFQVLLILSLLSWLSSIPCRCKPSIATSQHPSCDTFESIF